MGPRDLNSFESMFDFNRDGELGSAEAAMMYEFLDRELKRENRDYDDDFDDDDDFDSDYDDFDSDDF